MAALFSPAVTENAVANGDTRTISLVHAHTRETISATFRVGGQYDSAVLEKLNWFLRDWRLDEPTKMEPRLFDLVWEAYRESGSREPILVMSAYRSPQTNAMLRRRSRAVAEHSQHILGKAMDQHYMDVPMSRVREIGMRLQRGGVGYYPTAGSPFVHLDVGSVRHWPKMSYDQLARIFPDGKTVHIPSNGQPMARYEDARAEIEASGGTDVPISSIGKSKGFFATLFGGGEDDEVAVPVGRSGRAGQRSIQVASAATGSSGGTGSNNFFLSEAQRTPSPAADVALANNARLSRRGKPLAPEKPAPTIEVAALAASPAPEPAQSSIKPPQPLAGSQRNLPVAETIVPLDAPLPPRRPASLAAFLVAEDVPLPPVRPVELGAQTASQPKPDTLGKLIAASNREGPLPLPDVILHGPGDSAKPRPIPALGYAANENLAPPVRPVILARPGITAAVVRVATVKPVPMNVKVDRVGLNAMTDARSTEQDQPRSAIGAAAPPLRSNRNLRVQIASVFAEPLSGTSSHFEVGAASLPTDHFLPQ